MVSNESNKIAGHRNPGGSGGPPGSYLFSSMPLITMRWASLVPS